MTDALCLRMETLLAEVSETKRCCLIGDRFMARYHAGQVLALSNKLKFAPGRKAAMSALNKLKRNRAFDHVHVYLNSGSGTRCLYCGIAP